jgi:predicted unusual protein kinase regulating ubiquinone biosynthesis (AarF/ABC1/UbiB family)
MDYVRGRKVSRVALLRRWDTDGDALAEELFRAYLKQILVDGFFHADPHPGNVFLTDDARIALLDLGMVARIGPEMQDTLLKWLLAVSEGRGEEAARIALRMGRRREGAFDEDEFTRRINNLVLQNESGATLDRIEVGRIVLEATRISGDCGVTLPRELTMLGKTLLNLDQVGRMLDPQFDPNASVRRNSARLMQQRVWKSLSPGNLFSSFLEMKEIVAKLPRSLSQILDNLAQNKLEVKVDAIDEERLIAGLHKIANRITLGLILAALIVAAAMLMRVPTHFQLMGYPGLAILLFIAAAGGGIALAVAIVLHDRKKPEQVRKG